MLLYLDCCCLNRPFDDLRQERVRMEATAVELIMQGVKEGKWQLCGSDALAYEIGRCKDVQRREAVEEMLMEASSWVTNSVAASELAKKIAEQGVRGMDATHLACATLASCDILLTVDRRLYAKASRLRDLQLVEAAMLATWIESYEEDPGP